MKAKLIVVGGTTSTTEVHLRLPTTIGRGRSAQVTIPHHLVSRQHCEISEVEGRLVVRDLDSMNGTYVGDERITEAILEPGALLTVGTVTFRAIYDVGGDDSPPDDADDTCRETPTSDATETQDVGDVCIADSETVPVGPAAFCESLLPPRVPDAGEAATKPMSDLSGDASLESVAQNSD
ncbi:MAG: FHA domain-containing protein [Planctomycetota bacterium]|nr:FHA domain-containing protein [Planctomycetota bacterium]